MRVLLSRPIPLRSLRQSLFHLAHLLAAGLPLGDALQELLTLESDSRSRLPWRMVANRVAGGMNLSDAMSSESQAFSPLLLVLVRTGEAGGSLAEALSDAEILLAGQIARRERLLTVLAYPLFATLVVLFTVAFLLLVVVPNLGQALDASATALSWHTRCLLMLSTMLREYGHWMLAVLLFPSLSIGMAALLSPRFRQRIDRLVLDVPLLGNMLTQLSLARYAQVWARLSRAGLSHPGAMHLAEAMLANRSLERELRQLRLDLQGGADLSRALQRRQLPSLFARLLIAGESAGDLPTVLERIDGQMQAMAERRLRRVEAMTGPLLMICLGFVLGWMVVSLLSPLQSIGAGAW